MSSTRRQIIKGAGIAAVAGATAATGNAAQARAPAGGRRWDRSADIVCVGAGAASLTAAVFAKEAGRDVVVLEKGPVIGGTTARSGGVFWIPNHPLFHAQGVADYQAELPENKTPRGRALCPRRRDGSQGNGIDLVDQLAPISTRATLPSSRIIRWSGSSSRTVPWRAFRWSMAGRRR